ncbi:MAG: hypothetical protein GXP19_09865 [Gammaproteobacteria bacterium]|nr:hypothetical protein [Gammaproteobacteria bacterium]
MKNSYTQTLITILSLSASVICAPAFGGVQNEQKWYQVELILFANNKPEEAITESWPVAPGTSSVENKVELVTTNAGSANRNINVNATQDSAQSAQYIIPFSTIDKSEYKLTVTATRLKNSPNYDLLLHIGWRQPAFQSKDKSAVYIHDTENKNVFDNSIGDIAEIENNIGPVGPDTQRFFGTLKLTLSRFLHVDIDMVYRALIENNYLNSTDPLTPDSGNNEFPTSFSQHALIEEENWDGPGKLILQDFRLATSRRVKPDEIHYFDHPKFGLITMVTRYALPKPEEEESTIQPFIP